MKVYEINDIQFKEYGTVIEEDSINPEAYAYENESSSVKNRTNHLYAYTEPVVIEPREGVGVLFIQGPKGIMMFLLDKVLEIKAGTTFAVVPYQCRFRYGIYANTKRSVYPLDQALVASGIHRGLDIQTVYTVLYQEKAKKFRFKGERHPYWEITYMDRGHMICTVDGEEFLLKQGDLMFFAPNQFHMQRSADGKPVSFFTITFDLDFSNLDLIRNRVIKADMEIHRCVKQILVEDRMDLPYSEAMIIATLTKMMILAFRVANESQIVTHILSNLNVNTTHEILTNCIHYIDENISEKLTLPLLAEKNAVSPSYLTKLFKRDLGKTPGEYIRDARLQEAKRLIQEGAYSITQVSDVLGYCSVTYFSSEFKKKFGVNPRQYSKSVMV